MKITDNHETLSFWAGADEWQYTIELNFEEIKALHDMLLFCENQSTQPIDKLTTSILTTFAEVKAPVNS